MIKKTDIIIPIGKGVSLKGNLHIPDRAHALVIFSHGSGSSRFSSRNRYVAEILNKNNIATLLTDLLTEEENSVYETRFNIELITERLVAVINYAQYQSDLKDIPMGWFGASTGAASALRAAARLPDLIKAVVSRGGRPDLAGPFLHSVKAPTLLAVGSLDSIVITLNEQAYSQLTCRKELKIINGATHLFEEPGKLHEVAELAAHWFRKYLIRNAKLVAVK